MHGFKSSRTITPRQALNNQKSPLNPLGSWPSPIPDPKSSPNPHTKVHCICTVIVQWAVVLTQSSYSSIGVQTQLFSLSHSYSHKCWCQLLEKITKTSRTCWLSASVGWKILPKDCVIDVSTTVELQSGLQGNDGTDISCRDIENIDQK